MLTLSCSAHFAYSPLAQFAFASALLAAHSLAAASFAACLPAGSTSGHCSPDADAAAREAASHDQPRCLVGREGRVRGLSPCERGGSVTSGGTPPSHVLGVPLRSGCCSRGPGCSAATAVLDDGASAALLGRASRVVVVGTSGGRRSCPPCWLKGRIAGWPALDLRRRSSPASSSDEESLAAQRNSSKLLRVPPGSFVKRPSTMCTAQAAPTKLLSKVVTTRRGPLGETHRGFYSR
jgi:hypothetical protein